MKLPLAAGLVTSVIVAAALVAGSPAGANAPGDAARIPVLLELFTSEGCSSCPPADRLLESLDRQPIDNADLIVLSEHVDYWNYLGWKDPYSLPLFSARQGKYSDRLGSGVYTPQMVIDGRIQVLGSDRREATQGITQALRKAKLPVSVRATSGVVHVEANSRGANADLYIAIASDRGETQVLRGENRGQTLSHVAVAHSITRIGKWEGSGPAQRDLPIPSQQFRQASPGAKPGETRVVAILQDPQTGEILGVAQTRI
jgi:hypothetical protein